MKQKDLLLWVIAVVALVISVFNMVQIRIQPLKSDAAMRPVIDSQSEVVRSVIDNPGGGVGSSCYSYLYQIYGTIEVTPSGAIMCNTAKGYDNTYKPVLIIPVT